MTRKIAASRTEKKLFLLVQSDDIKAFKDIYSRGLFDKEVHNSQGLSLLSESVRRGATKIADFMLEQNPEEMSKLDMNNREPLSYLSPLRSNEDMVYIFKAHGFDFSKKISKKGNILHLVAPSCKKDLFDELVKAGANPKEKNETLGTPERVAQGWGNIQLSQYIENAYNKPQTEFDFAP